MPIFEFHKFSESLQSIIFDGEVDCWETLGEYLEMAGKNTANKVLKESEQNMKERASFKIRKLKTEASWIKDFRQQIHLELGDEEDDELESKCSQSKCSQSTS